MKRTPEKKRAARGREGSGRKADSVIRSSVRGRVITATEAARSFSVLLDRVEYRGEAFVVERGGGAVCEIRPVGPATFRLSDLAALLATGPKPDSAYWTLVERLTHEQSLVAPSPWER